MTARPATLVLLATASLVACGSTPTTTAPTGPAMTSTATPVTASSAAPQPSQTATAAAPLDPTKARALPATATFRDLVRAARVASTRPSASTCLLRGGKAGEPATLEAPLDQGAGKLVDPPADLDALLRSPPKQVAFATNGLRVLTPWGHTDGGDFLDLQAFTPASRALSASVTPVLLVTDKGLYLGLPGRTGDGRPLDESERARVVKDLVPMAKAWVITAEGDAPIARLRQALELISATRGTVILASPLPAASAPEARASRYDHRVEAPDPHACEPNAAFGAADKAGQYELGSLARVGKAFDAATAGCGDPLGAGSGGSIHVLMKINANGAVEKACAETDDIGDAAVRKCVVEQARSLKLPRPEKAGVVSFGTAAVFTGKVVQALCDP